MICDNVIKERNFHLMHTITFNASYRAYVSFARYEALSYLS